MKMTSKKTPKRPYVDRPLDGLFYWERRPKGEIGIEVEVEGGPWPEDSAPNWVTHADGSLRNGGIEYVIRQPVLRDRVLPALNALAVHLTNSNKVFSYRTSIHVHVNVQRMTLRQWINYISLFCIFEELLVNVIGPERAGNKFCLRFKDADESIRLLRTGILDKNIPDLLSGDLKYASCNLRATVSHGTLEFRAMRGNLDTAFIHEWVQVLLVLKDAAIATRDPSVFVEEMSMLGPRDFAIKYLPVNNTITTGVLNQFDLLSNSMYEGARLAQDVAYCIDWEEPFVDVGPSYVDTPEEVEPEADVLLAAEPQDPHVGWGDPPAPFRAAGIDNGLAARAAAIPDHFWRALDPIAPEPEGAAVQANVRAQRALAAAMRDRRPAYRRPA